MNANVNAKTRLVLKPGQKGTKKLMDKYGDRLVCVRYRYDADRKMRLKTIEIVIDETHWENNERGISPSRLVYLRIEGYVTILRRVVKNAGGIWNPKKKLWQLTYGDVCKLGLKSKMISESFT